MITFKQFLIEQELLLCGGNVQIGDNFADRIDLQKINRSDIVKTLNDGLDAINTSFEKSFGLPLWNESLFKSKEFLSGSAFHFFNLQTIGDDEFVKVKSTVGDVDLQVDGNMAPMVKQFLDDNKGATFGSLTFIGYKSSTGQYISLWKLPEFNINVQIDFELVDYDSAGNPNSWSQFSHSSTWNDLKAGIKGVFSKFLYSSLTAPKAKPMIIKAKTARGKDKIVNKGESSFSVSHGLRVKYSPILGADGSHVYENGMPTYTELSTTESSGERDLGAIFTAFFDKIPTNSELKDMSSFIGTLSLIKQHKNSDIKKIADAFVDKLWGTNAQGLYRGNPSQDLNEKTAAILMMCTEFGLHPKQYDDLKVEYYKNYK